MGSLEEPVGRIVGKCWSAARTHLELSAAFERAANACGRRGTGW